MAKTFSATPRARIFNRVLTTAIKLGIPAGPVALLTVTGRKSGQPHETPVTIVTVAGERFITSPYGESQWVKNLRAAGGATLRTSKGPESIRVEELDATHAAPVLREMLAKAPSFLHAYYDVKPGAPLADFERDAPNHPVFQIVATAPTT